LANDNNWLSQEMKLVADAADGWPEWRRQEAEARLKQVSDSTENLTEQDNSNYIEPRTTPGNPAQYFN